MTLRIGRRDVFVDLAADKLIQIKFLVIISQNNHHLLLFNKGWEGKKHIHNCLFHGKIKNDKIWVYFDGFEDTITEAMINE